MPDKDRQKKDGERKDRDNQEMHEAVAERAADMQERLRAPQNYFMEASNLARRWL